MYSKYFGLKEPSFSITPDPRYLFLSEQHREGLAHLLYGAGESGGFVLLTGEVGMGKTTVCRAFLEQLPERVDVALILNPAMTVTEMLRAVCDELRIPVPEDECTVKRLVDRLNRYLLEAHANGRRPVLMIDEAQNLRPRVLEQIRLLTNLETAKHKLLQIFLVGQPELRTLLQSEGMRQLDQRITARYHLRPFRAQETAQYVRHRLAVSGVERQLFTRAALRRVQRFSGGVPRLINILCDRALLGACVARSPLVTWRIVGRAAREVKDDAAWRQPRLRPVPRVLAAAALLVAIGAGWLSHAWLSDAWTPRVPAVLARWLPPDWVPSVWLAPEPTPPEAAPPGPAPADAPVLAGAPRAAAMPETPRAVLADLAEKVPAAPVDLTGVLMDRTSAMRVLLRRWGAELGDVGAADPCDRVATFGLRCEPDQGGWNRLRAFDLPALIKLRDAKGNEGYAALGALDEELATFDLLEGSRRLPVAGIDQAWKGEYLVVWQPPPMGSGAIGPGASRDAVRWLRKLLSQVPDLAVKDTGSGSFDAAIEEGVRRFQERAGLASDGVAGPRTLIRLYNAVAMPGIPHLKPAP